MSARDDLAKALADIQQRQRATDDEQARLWRIANEEDEPGDYDPEEDAEPGSVKAYEYAEDFALESYDSLYLSDLTEAVRKFLAAPA